MKTPSVFLILSSALFLSLLHLTPVRAVACKFQWKKPITLKQLTVPVGTTCTWTWADALSHCVTPKKPNPDGWITSPQLTGKGKTYSHTFKKPGLYKFHCCVHVAFMKGSVLVTAKKTIRPRSNMELGCSSSSCNGKCYGTDGCGNSCGVPPVKTFASCTACCKIGRSADKLTIDSCVKECMGVA